MGLAEAVAQIINSYNKAMSSGTAATFGSVVFGVGLYLIAYYTPQAKTNIIIEVCGALLCLHGVLRLYFNLYKDVMSTKPAKGKR